MEYTDDTSDANVARRAGQCAYKACTAAATVGLCDRRRADSYASADGPLGFCRKHGAEMHELEATYKALQARPAFRSFADNSAETEALQLAWTPGALREMARLLRVCADQRREFQTRLKENVPREGHALFILRLERHARALDNAAAQKEPATAPRAPPARSALPWRQGPRSAPRFLG